MANEIKLSEEQVKRELGSLRGWEQKDGEIAKTFAFPDFMAAVRFVNRLAPAAEAADHHPDILILYRKVRLTLSTHSAGGLTPKDFDLARRIEPLAAER